MSRHALSVFINILLTLHTPQVPVHIFFLRSAGKYLDNDRGTLYENYCGATCYTVTEHRLSRTPAVIFDIESEAPRI